MKKVLRIGITVVVITLLLTIGAVVIFLRNFDLNNHKERITDAIGKALNTDVAVGNMELNFNFKQGIVIDVEDVSLLDKGNLAGVKVDVQEIKLAIDLKKLFKGAEISIIEIGLREPIIKIDLEERGRFTSDQKNNFSTSAPESTEGKIKIDEIKFSIHNLWIMDGEVVVLANGKNILKDFEAKNIDISVKDFWIDREKGDGKSQAANPFSAMLSFNAFDMDVSLVAQGGGMVDAVNQQMRLDDVEVKGDLSKLSLGRLAETFPAALNLELQDLRGKINFIISQVIVDTKGVPVFALKGAITEGFIKSNKMPIPLSDVNIFCEYSNSNLDILDSRLFLAGGQVDFKGRAEDIFKTQMYRGEATLTNVDISQFALQLPEDIEAEGSLNGKALLNGAGFDVPEVIKNLKGSVDFSTDQATLKNINLLNYIFEKISIIPNLAQRFEQSLPEEYRQKMQENQTIIESAQLNMTVNNGVISYQGDLSADTAMLDMRGTVDWRQNLLFEGKFMLPQTLSTYLVAEVEEFSTVVDGQSGKIVIPLKSYQGPVSDFKPFPDIEYLSKNLLLSKAKEKVRDLLKDFITVKDQGEPAGESVEGQEEKSEGQQKSDKKPDLVDTIFDSLF